MERCSYEVKSMKIEFKLAKQAPGVRWNKLEGDEEVGDSTTTMPSSKCVCVCICVAHPSPETVP